MKNTLIRTTNSFATNEMRQQAAKRLIILFPLERSRGLDSDVPNVFPSGS
jgi:hypothetical protein